ncbi:MAG: ABC transporter ATP-binding protein/permease [Actinomycetota bacterium]|nr:ABC transporter ATP-binding protein/permease [Actinomycetota bacterium]
MSEQRSVVWRGLRIIASYIATHPVPFAVSVTGATIYAGMTVASTIVLGRITDHVLVPAFREGVRPSTIMWGVVAIMAVGVIRAAGVIMRRYFAGMTGARMRMTLTNGVVDRYQQLPLAYHRSKPAGELIAHAEADVMAAIEVIHPLPWSLAVILLIVFATVALVLTDPFLALIGITVLPGLAFLNRYYSRRVEDPASKAQQRIGEVSSVVHESVDGALMVKTLGREEAEVARLAEKASALRNERIRMGRLRAAFEPTFEAIPAIGIIILIAVGAWRVSTDAITVGTLVQFVSLFELLAFPMRLIGFLLSEVPRAVVGRERLEEVFREPITLPQHTKGLSLPEGPLSVSARSVSFAYGVNRVLEDVSFDIQPNESVALVGPTGSGKSTLAQLLVRLADPERGSIHLGGVDLRDVDPATLRAAAAIVFQESFLFASTVRENIALELDLPHEDIERAARLAQAHDFIRELPAGYDTVLGERGVTLSGGQRQRVALARALVRRPRLLILDDATSAVDPTVEAAILAGLRDELDMTLVVVAYRVSTISLADRVLFLDRGRIVSQGTHQQLLSHPAYLAMVSAYERGAA